MFLVKQAHDSGPEWHPWGPNHAYAVGDRVGVDGSAVIFRCSRAGKSGAEPPKWPDTTHLVTPHRPDPEEPHVGSDIRTRLPAIGDGEVEWIASTMHHGCSGCGKHLKHQEELHHECPTIPGGIGGHIIPVTRTLCAACADTVHAAGAHVRVSRVELEALALAPRGAKARTAAIRDRVLAEKHPLERVRVAIILSRAERGHPVTR